MSIEAPNTLPKIVTHPQSGGHPFTRRLLRDLAIDIIVGGAMIGFGLILFVWMVAEFVR
jgi:hypothetical protein